MARGAQGERIGVYIDERFAFDLAAAVVADADLHKGDVLSEEREASLLVLDQPYRARNLAVSMLSRRELCRREVAVRLERAGFEDHHVADTLCWLEERGYVDDLRFSAAYASERLKAGWGRRRVVGELLRKGVRREIADGEAWVELPDVVSDADLPDAVVALVRRRFGRALAFDPEGARARIAGFLARRGHDWCAIERITRLVSEEAGSDMEGAQR